MLRSLAISAVAAAGLLLLPGPATTKTEAAPSIAPKFDVPESAVEQVRRRGGGGFRGRSFGGRSFGGRSFSGRSFRGRSFYSGRSFRGGSRFYGGRSYRRHYAYYGGRRHRHRGWRHGIIIGAGLPFFYGGGYYSSCGYYYRRWMRTGSWYWRERYYDCRYYW